MKRKHSTETPVCPQERLVIISYTTGLSFALERIGPLAAIIMIVFYLLVLYLLALPNTPENPFAIIYSESSIKTACQHLLLLVGFDTLIYRKYYDTPPILVGHHPADFYLLESFLSLCVFHPAEVVESFCDPPPSLRFSGRQYTRMGDDRGGQERPHHLAARPRAGPCQGWCGPLVAQLVLSFWLLPSSGKIGTSRYFPRIADLQKYGVLTVLFLAEFWLRQWIL
jgi:hypothetical protein